MKFGSLALAAILAPALALAAGAARADTYHAGSIDISQPWSRSTVAAQPAGGGFLTLTNHGGDDTLVAVRADVSQMAQLHTMSMDGQVMRMRQVDNIPVPAGKTVELKPGAYHVMFLKLKAPLKEGSRFPATLVFAKAGEVKVEFEVKGPGAAASH